MNNSGKIKRPAKCTLVKSVFRIAIAKNKTALADLCVTITCRPVL